ncbi:MAG: nitroreductase family protein [Nitrososphaerota archaeon]|nr:nitroreductase family protein [Candidatus Bathyarchaeota archaeon]MDW8022664.1 nitroreductase family protein [Nitrososphaerota archaeon]
MDVIEAIKSRRSIRKFKPDPVEKEKLEAVLEAARWAPSWANTQCWEFIIVKDSETKRRLAETLTPWNPAVDAVKKAPIVIVACAKLGVSGFFGGKPVTDKGDFFMFDVALALQNLALAAHSLGLGTLHVGAFDAGKVAEILSVPSGVSVVELMPLGYPMEAPKATRRKELRDFVYFERYGQKVNVC